MTSRFPHLEGEGTFSFEIVGESHYQQNLDGICGGKSLHGHQHYCTAHLSTEPDNPYDKNAVAVYIDGHQVGYLPRAAAKAFSKYNLETVTADAVIVGGWLKNNGSSGHYGVRLDLN